MKILIIGCKGFVGSNAVQYFLEKGDTVIGYDLLPADGRELYPYYQRTAIADVLASLFREHQPDACLNAGGNGSVPLSISNPQADFSANVDFLTEVLEIIRRNSPRCKFVHLSSAAVYGNPQQLPISESSPVMPISPYGWHKYQAEQVCREFYSLYQVPAISLRVFSVYGPGLRKQLFWDTYQKSKNNKVIRLFGTGKESRDFIFIKDLVAAINLLLTEALFEGQVINVSSGIETTIAAAMAIFTRLLGDYEVAFTGEENPGNPLNWQADISQLKRFGFTAKVNLEQGLNETVQWLKENA